MLEGGLVPENARSFVVGDQNEPCDSVERKLVRLSATGLSPSRVQHSTASPLSAYPLFSSFVAASRHGIN